MTEHSYIYFTHTELFNKMHNRLLDYLQQWGGGGYGYYKKR
jgi:hypothetical protein